jgi:hypothetical protein
MVLTTPFYQSRIFLELFIGRRQPALRIIENIADEGNIRDRRKTKPTVPPGFPLKACGNDDFRSEYLVDVESSGSICTLLRANA